MTHSRILTSDRPETQPCSLVWIRRDLRLEDHAALAKALSYPEPIQLVFVFDQTILRAIPGADDANQPCDDRRVGFIHAAIEEISGRLSASGGHLITRYGDPRSCIPDIVTATGACRLIFAHDDEPAALARDQAVTDQLRSQSIQVESVKDQCIFERSEVLTGSATPFSVFTPYKNAWLKRFTPNDAAARATGAGQPKPGKPVGAALAQRLLPASRLGALASPVPTMASMGFRAGNLEIGRAHV